MSDIILAGKLTRSNVRAVSMPSVIGLIGIIIRIIICKIIILPPQKA